MPSSAETVRALPTLDRATEDLKWYVHLLCADKPERYEVFQMRGTETRLSDSCRVVLDALAAAVARVERAEQRVEELEGAGRFVQWVRQEWHHEGDIDGGALQDALVECRLLTPTQVEAACEPENCQCAEYGDFPLVCYRWTDAARAQETPTTPGDTNG